VNLRISPNYMSRHEHGRKSETKDLLAGVAHFFAVDDSNSTVC